VAVCSRTSFRLAAALACACLAPPPVAAQSESSQAPERGFFPLFGTIVAGSSVAAGGGYRDYGLLGSALGFEVSGMASVRGYQVYRVHLGLLGPHRRALDLRPADAPVSSMLDDGTRNRPGFSVYLDARYRHYPRQRFYGIGPDSRAGDRSDYLLKGGSYDLVVQWQKAATFGLSARVGILDSRIEEGRDDRWPDTQAVFDPTSAPGLARPPRYLVSGLGAALDTRDNPGDPRAGTFLGAVVWRFDARGPAGFDFTRLAFDARTYLRPGRLPGVVAVRGILSADLASSDSQVPFFLQQTLGGGELLRAWESARFRDRTLAHATVEYRWHAHRLLEIAPFVDAGTLGPGAGALRLAAVKVGAGVGLRAHFKDRVLGRLDWAWGRDGTRVVFGVGPIF
jgi:hypothetical protein